MFVKQGGRIDYSVVVDLNEVGQVGRSQDLEVRREVSAPVETRDLELAQSSQKWSSPGREGPRFPGCAR